MLAQKRPSQSLRDNQAAEYLRRLYRRSCLRSTGCDDPFGKASGHSEGTGK